ncbi:unnamed protein product [Phytomonas sp. Hart1]|nr:unnamed protein product [Phytomonas sp. Hart1]|eukprot:CCW67782.1 unnamed protein product [Phytomonas sp. isolate Hart1]
MTDPFDSKRCISPNEPCATGAISTNANSVSPKDSCRNKCSLFKKKKPINESHLKFEMDLVWENLTYEVLVKGKKGEEDVYKPLITNFSGRAKAGRVLAIMGPSGAGKTTFLGCITGTISNSSGVMKGCCFLNNTVYQQRYKALTSFVCQDDIVMCKDTPREAINFSARLRLGLSKEEADQRVEEVIERLHLTKCQNTYLGMPGILKGVSGGERKRTNIGAELVTNPFILLLDEPTTGLDSVNALRVGQLLQDLAKNDHRTVITTIHSPSSDLFEQFDDLLLLAKGYTIYHGPADESVDYFTSIGYKVPSHTNPTEYYMNIMQLPEEIILELKMAWENHVASDASRNNPCLVPLTGPITTSNPDMEEIISRRYASYYLQVYMLFTRALRMFFRDSVAFVGRWVQTILFGVLFGLFFFGLKLNDEGVQDRKGSLYMVLVSGLFTSISAGVSSFATERPIFLREQATCTYNASIFFVTKALAELPFQILFPSVLCTITYFMMHLYRSADAFFSYLFIMILFANLGYSLGLFIASFFKDAQVAFAVMPAIMLPLFITAGLFSNTERLIPYWEWLMYISFPRHAYIGSVVNEFSRLDVICNPVTPTCSIPNGKTEIELLGFSDWRVWKTYVSLGSYYVGFLILGGISLQVQGMKQRRMISFVENVKDRVASPRVSAASPTQRQPPTESPLKNSQKTPQKDSALPVDKNLVNPLRSGRKH